MRSTWVQAIDASNETVMPGFIDMHARLDAGDGEALGRLLLAYGITSARDPETHRVHESRTARVV